MKKALAVLEMEIDSINNRLTNLRTQYQQAFMQDWEKLQALGTKVKEYNPSFALPWESATDDSRRNYCVRNVKDAILEVLPTRQSQGITASEIHAAILSARPPMKYVMGTIYAVLSPGQFDKICGYVSHDGYIIVRSNNNRYYKKKK